MGSLPQFINYNAGQSIQFGEAGQKQRTLADLGQRAAAGDLAGASSAAFAGGQVDIGAALAKMDQQKHQAIIDDAASLAQGANTPEEWAAAGQQYKTLHPEVDWPADFRAKNAVVSRALTAQQQIDNRFKEQQLALDKQKTDAVSVAAGATADDAKAIAGAMVSGDQPPDMKGLYSKSAPVRAELARQGYDLTTAQLDYAATSKRVASLNSTQQVRLQQAIGALPDMLDKIEGLGQRWQELGKNTSIPLLNKGSLAAAKQGAFGAEAQAVATQLEAQIADVSADLATVYRGGNSPTDSAMEHADQQLNGSWSWDTLKGMVKLARDNVRYRQNSIRLISQGSPNNPYDARAGATAGAADGNLSGDEGDGTGDAELDQLLEKY